MSEVMEQVAVAWDNLPRDAKMRMFTDPGLSDLYWACARVAAHRQAEAEVEELLTPTRPHAPTTDPDHPQE